MRISKAEPDFKGRTAAAAGWKEGSVYAYPSNNLQDPTKRASALSLFSFSLLVGLKLPLLNKHLPLTALECVFSFVIVQLQPIGWLKLPLLNKHLPVTV